MKINIFPIITLIAIVSCTPKPETVAKGESDNSADDRPNIIVILADDLGYNDVSYNGATDITTPQIDALANNGVIFKNGYVTQSFCGPSRAGLLTGRHQARFGMDHNIDHAPADQHHGLPLNEKTFAKRLQEVGYRTGIIGKWHLGSAAHFQPLQRGFDYFYGFVGGGHNYFPDDIDLRGDTYKIPMQENHGLGEFDEYLTTELSNQAAKFIKESTDPYLLYVAYNAPHAPLEAPQEFIDKYSHIEDEDRRVYLAMIDAMDQGIGIITDALKESGEFDNTLIFFLSDNGGVFSEAWLPTFDWSDNSPFRRGKASLLEGGLHVPFIAHWPAKIQKGKVFDGLVSALDIAATSVAISGAVAHKDSLDGVNLEPYFTGEKTGSPHDVLYWRYDNGTWAVRTLDYKYMNQGLPNVGLCFFDMVNDPYEKENIIGKNPDKQKELAEIWNAWNSDNINNILPPAYNYKKDKKNMYDKFYQECVDKSDKAKVYKIK